MSVMTVLGPVAASTLGINLPFVHLFSHLRTRQPDPAKSRLRARAAFAGQRGGTVPQVICRK